MTAAIEPIPIIDGIAWGTKQRVKAVCAKLGMPSPVKWGTIATPPENTAALSMVVAPMELGFGFASGWMIEPTFSETEVEALIYHELGHVHYGDLTRDPYTVSMSECHEAEFRADRFAIQHGYAESLLSAFRRIRKLTGEEYAALVGHTHPALNERIRRLQAFVDVRGEAMAA